MFLIHAIYRAHCKDLVLPSIIIIVVSSAYKLIINIVVSQKILLFAL